MKTRPLCCFLTRCLSAGIETGEFEPVPVDETASLLVAYINGIIRYKAMNLGETNKMRQTAIDFCRRSLMNGNMNRYPLKTEEDKARKSQEQT